MKKSYKKAAQNMRKNRQSRIMAEKHGDENYYHKNSDRQKEFLSFSEGKGTKKASHSSCFNLSEFLCMSARPKAGARKSESIKK